eukprot:301701-Chlamydomonas_euryale.AAC.2
MQPHGQNACAEAESLRLMQTSTLSGPHMHLPEPTYSQRSTPALHLQCLWQMDAPCTPSPSIPPVFLERAGWAIAPDDRLS